MTTATRLIGIIEHQFGIKPEAIDPDAPFASYKVDSLTLAELLFAIEDDFKLTVPDEVATSVHTLNQLAAALDAVIAGLPMPVFEPPAKAVTAPAAAQDPSATAAASAATAESPARVEGAVTPQRH
jgi:acyl carrier protein